jgi:hypothetical protein
MESCGKEKLSKHGGQGRFFAAEAQSHRIHVLRLVKLDGMVTPSKPSD